MARGSRGKRVLSAALLLSLLVSLPVGAAPSLEESRRKLERTEQQLKKLQQELKAELGKQDRLQAELAAIEREQGEIRRALEALRRQQAESRKARDEAGDRVARLERERTRQAELLKAQLRALFAHGEPDLLRLLLSQEDPQRLARMLRYQQKIGEARLRLIEDYRTLLAELQGARTTLSEREKELAEREAALRARQQALARSEKRRSAALARLRESLSDKQRQLARLKADRRALAALVEKLRRMLAEQELAAAGTPFARLKGKLKLPTAGRILRAFGSREHGVALDGIEIAARAGDPVRAVHGGRVVYADWLRGYGLLLVLDHGDGYMTLYGNNQSLLRDVGDWVAPREVIARVGESGGAETPRLYFALRKNGKPLDPVAWIRR